MSPLFFSCFLPIGILYLVFSSLSMYLLDFSSLFSELVDQVLKYNTTKDCLRKLEVIHSYIQKLTFNLNVSLMLDSFIIDFSGGEYSHV